MDFSQINLNDYQDLARLIIKEVILKKITKRNDFEKIRNKIIKKHSGKIFHNLYFIKAYQDLLNESKIKDTPEIIKIIRKRGVRSLSGVSPVTVLTKPYPCPGQCSYCPTDARMPKSYLVSQPAAQRGFRQKFNPYSQIYVRLKALKMTGHPISKVELRIIGGSFNAYPKQYQTWFIKRCLQAMNEFSERYNNSSERLVKKQLIIKSSGGRALGWDEVSEANEIADIRCIGLNIETRPDLINSAEIRRLRALGVTKIELGVQSLDDQVLVRVNRGHSVQDVIEATALLKDAGFKIGYHLMPNLPGTTLKLDQKMCSTLFTDSNFQPDYLKIYPCILLPGTETAKEFRAGKYKPYSDRNLYKVLKQNLADIPEWCRIDRIARDIPANEILSGFKISNIRQLLEQELEKAGQPVRDIRAREIKTDQYERCQLVKRIYAASGGEEVFLSYEDLEKDKIIALLRLRKPSKKSFLPGLKGKIAIIREVHVYGVQVSVGQKDRHLKQHQGLGKKLMIEAEKIAKEAGYKKIAVISGIGTREYYRKRGYKLKETYMVKDIN